MVTFSIDKSFHGCSVEFSPFNSSKLACAASQNFGLKGQGCLYILLSAGNGLTLLKRFIYDRGLYDLAWSENDERIIITASNDGSLQMWNIESKQGLIKTFRAHEKEVNSVAWSLTRGTKLFVSGSWDHSVKLWDPVRGNCVETYLGHRSIVYCVAWSPHLAGHFLSSSGDGDARIWDMRCAQSNSVIQAKSGELLSCDWTKYEHNIFVTSGTDSTIRVWDLRALAAPVSILRGHEFPARRIKCSPHRQNQLASASYDKSVRIWDYALSELPIQTIKSHSEFVTGIDFNLTNPTQLVDCSWDETIRLHYPESLR